MEFAKECVKNWITRKKYVLHFYSRAKWANNLFQSKSTMDIHMINSISRFVFVIWPSIKKNHRKSPKLKGRCLRCIGVYSATGERLLVFITNIQLDKILVARSTKDYDSRTLLWSMYVLLKPETEND